MMTTKQKFENPRQKQQNTNNNTKHNTKHHTKHHTKHNTKHNTKDNTKDNTRDNTKDNTPERATTHHAPDPDFATVHAASQRRYSSFCTFFVAMLVQIFGRKKVKVGVTNKCLEINVTNKCHFTFKHLKKIVEK